MVDGAHPYRSRRLAGFLETRRALGGGGRLLLNCGHDLGRCDPESQAHIMQLLDNLREGPLPGFVRWDTSPMGGTGLVSSSDALAALPPLLLQPPRRWADEMGAAWAAHLEGLRAGVRTRAPVLPAAGSDAAFPGRSERPQVAAVGEEWAPVSLFRDDGSIVLLLSAKPRGSSGMATTFTVWHTTWPDRPFEASGEAAATAMHRLSSLLDLDGYGTPPPLPLFSCIGETPTDD